MQAIATGMTRPPAIPLAQHSLAPCLAFNTPVLALGVESL